MSKYCVILWTCKNMEEAKEITSSLLEEKLIACANFIPQIESMFCWKNKIELEKEVQVFFKTRSDHFEKVKEYIANNCSYEVPEILQIFVERGHTPYLDWIDTYVK